MKHMNKLRVALCAAAVVVAVAFFACNKETETGAAIQTPETEEVVKKSIAVFDNKSNLITTFVDAEAINTKLDEHFHALKNNANRFVVESVVVLDSVPRNKEVLGEIRITLLDTEKECSYSIWLMKSFVVKDVKEQQVDYYLDDNVANGKFDIAFKAENAYYVADFVGDSLSIHEIDILDYSCHPWVSFYCRSIDCTNQCDKNGSALNAWCKQCPYHDGQCKEESVIPTVIGIISLARFIIFLL